MNDSDRILLALAGIFVLGVGGHWIGWRVRMPSILLLLGLGIFFGPVMGWLNPDRLFGALLLPAVSLSVGVILFEGSLSLRLSDLRAIGRPLTGLLTVGMLLTWWLAAASAAYVLQFSWEAALLVGAILVVTGPTVIGPLLQHIRPLGPVGPIARWEGIVIDPMGAALALLVFEAMEAMRAGTVWQATQTAALGLIQTLAIGLGIGLITAMLLAWFLRRHWIPDHLQSAVALAGVLAAFAASHLLQHESGLLTVTVMGIFLANQRLAVIKQIVDFKENLSVLLIAVLFIVLAARVELQDFFALGWRGPLFVALLILVVRPVSVLLATWNAGLTWRERTFLAWLAPRGIVAAAVSSVFALRLGEEGGQLVAATFLVITGTVLVYALTSGRCALALGLSVRDPQGLLMAGAHELARQMAGVLLRENVQVQLVDTNRGNVRAALNSRLPALEANVLSESAEERLNLAGIGRFLALTPNDEVNSLACQHYSEIFGQVGVFRLAPAPTGKPLAQTSFGLLEGRVLFGKEMHYKKLASLVEEGWVVKGTRLTDKFTFQDFTDHYGTAAIPLFAIDRSKRITVFTDEDPAAPRPSQTLVALVTPGAATPQPAAGDTVT